MANSLATITGDLELMAELKSLAHDFQRGELLQSRLLKGAQGLRDKIKSSAPKGFKGNLRRSIVAKKYKHYTPGNPAVFVGIHNKTAPHAWLVEHGAARGQPAVAGIMRSHGTPTATGKKALHWRGGGGGGRTSWKMGSSRSGGKIGYGDFFFSQ